MPKKDMTGKVFSRLTVLETAGKEPQGQWKWLCLCICGNKTVVTGRNLRRGHTTSCGCYQIERTTKHGHNRSVGQTPEYICWHSMIQRCNNKNAASYPDYGGRGISVCERWLKFENFLADMGSRTSPKHSLDRFPDINGNYEPSNCRWATIAEQLRNKRNSVWIEYKGEAMVAADWAKRLGIKSQTITNRIKRGASIEEALSVRRQRPPFYIEYNGVVKNCNQWERQFGIPKSTLKRMLKKRTVEKIFEKYKNNTHEIL